MKKKYIACLFFIMFLIYSFVIVLIEAITRKKVSEKVELTISYIGLGLLLALTFFVTVKDIIRIV